MTAKSRRKHNRGVSKTMSKGTPDTSAESISQSTRDASAETVSEGAPGASLEMISSGCANAGELNENELAASTNVNLRGNIVLQYLLHEWFGFVGMRMRQHMHLIETIQGCRSLPDVQQAYTQFWQNAFTQYDEETRRILLITQGAVNGASHAAHGNGATQATLH